MIDVDHLTKRYGSRDIRLAVDDVSFRIGKGEVVGFLGPNGAGKSTTLRILSGFLGMTSGTVKIAGHDIADDTFEARKSIGYMPEAVPLYPEMRVVEYLTFRAELKRVARASRRAFIDDAMEKAKVIDVATQLIGKLSKGYRQRVGLADALVARPPILILDEPTAGLDPNQIREVREVIKGLAAEHTVLLSTHILSEVEASASRVLLIHRGKLAFDGPTGDIGKARRTAEIDVTVRGEADAAKRALESVDGVAKVSVVDRAAMDDGVTLRCVWKKDLSDAARATEAIVVALVAAGIGVREVRAAGGSLEDLFAELTRDDAPAAATSTGEAQP